MIPRRSKTGSFAARKKGTSAGGKMISSHPSMISFPWAGFLTEKQIDALERIYTDKAP